ncbi:hypothetical protein ABPG72_019359 [Tetrahymena utriculariae]
MDNLGIQKQQNNYKTQENNTQSFDQVWGYLTPTINQLKAIPLVNPVSFFSYSQGKFDILQDDLNKADQSRILKDDKISFRKSLKIIQNQNNTSIQCMDENIQVSLLNKKIKFGVTQQIQDGDILIIQNKADQKKQKINLVFSLNQTKPALQEKELKHDDVVLENIQLKNKISLIKQMDENIENDLNCAICLELMHNPVSIIGCLHCFCGDCLSKFIFYNGTITNLCPTCRQPIADVKQNSIIQSFIEKHLKIYPELKKEPSYYLNKDKENNFVRMQQILMHHNHIQFQRNINILRDEDQDGGSEYQRCFQQDLARAHQAKETLDLLEKHSINIAEWPPKGADLSPIELCFGEIQRRSKKLYSQIKSKEDLWNYMSEIVFEEDFTLFIQKCQSGMNRQVEKIQSKQRRNNTQLIFINIVFFNFL